MRAARALAVTIAGGGLAAALLTAGGLRPADPGTRTARPIYGFHVAGLDRQRDLEARLLKMADRARIEAHHRILTAEPHVAGTPENGKVQRYIHDRFREAGLETELKSYSVYMGFVTGATLAMVAPERHRLANPEDRIPGDPQSGDRRAALNWHAYSPACDLTREIVYANHARPEDFAALDALGIDVRDRLVLARNFKGYRGGKVLEATRRGAAGLILFSDPAEDGSTRGAVYPEGPWGPDGHIQRGSTALDFFVPGDPLTPGWASVPGARRIPPADAASLPRLPSIPISGRDALVILKRLGGPAAPRGWQGGLPVAYRVGPGPARLRLAIASEFGPRTITNVIGMLRGSEEPGRKVILGNHHDAWVYGGVDPSSGTATMLELARVAGDLARRGLRPRRTLVFGSWDAEEWTLTGSTEWGEEVRDDLAANGVACLNVDDAAHGTAFQATAVPTLRRLITEVLRDVPEPGGGRDLLAALRQAAPEGGAFSALYGVAAAKERAQDVRFDLLGSGSDYTVFFNHLGMPSLDCTFDGPYGVYHSVYDTHAWMKRFGDPGFRYHAAMAGVWGLMAYRMANADLLPFDEAAYPADLQGYLADLESEASGAGALPDLAPLRAAAAEWTRSAEALGRAVDRALAGAPLPREVLDRANALLMRTERDLLHAEGLPGRPWYRHLIYAPLPTYAAETLPGLREALRSGDAAGARTQAEIVAGAVLARAATTRQAAAVLEEGLRATDAPPPAPDPDGSGGPRSPAS